MDNFNKPKNKKRLIIDIFTLCLLHCTFFIAHAQTYAERLGFPKDAKVIIFHVDDAGMSYDSNDGTIRSMEKGMANSTSVMMPCGWSPAYMQYLKSHPKTDAGVHLTLTSEWKGYRWEPLLGKEKVPNLHDTDGAFWPNVEAVVKNASPQEVEAEIKAQIARFRSFGIEPTHIDSHMGTLFRPKFLPVYIKTGIEEKIPVMLPAGHCTLINQEMKISAAEKQMLQTIGKQLWDAGLPVIDDLYADSYSWKMPENIAPTDKNLQQFKTQKYIELLKNAKAGITMIIMHCTNPSDTFKYISDSAPTRKGDMLAMLDPNLKAFIEKEKIILTTWRELKERRK